jgi:transposase
MPSYDVATRAQALALKLVGIPSQEIEHITGIQPRTLNSIHQKAVARGLNPDESKKILDRHVEDGSRSGRPKKQTEEIISEVLSKVRTDRYGREKTCAQIALEVGGVSDITVWRILRASGHRKTKPTRKPGLTEDMREARLKFALDHKYWTVEDWKRVIWSDESSVVCGFRRGGYRVWRKPEERFNKSCIRPRWKGYSSFMFWGCFSWDKKGPCHIWKAETKAQRKENDKLLEKLNIELEPSLKAQWELEVPFRRMGLRNKPGRKPKWKWNKNHGKLVREGSGGIDWFLYCQQIVVPKLIPFAKELEEIRPGILIQEDGASAHLSSHKDRLYSLNRVQALLWPGNSPDLNMIEPAWAHLKRVTTKKGAPQTRAQAEKAWRSAWDGLEQGRIQAWIERIPRHIQKVIELEGGNEYQEGKLEKTRRFQSLEPQWEEPEWEDIE